MFKIAYGFEQMAEASGPSEQHPLQLTQGVARAVLHGSGEGAR